jgi:hypothetical protein
LLTKLACRRVVGWPHRLFDHYSYQEAKVSRLTKIMVALLASTAIAAPAFAITGDVSGFLHVRGVAADNMDGRDKGDSTTFIRTDRNGTPILDSKGNLITDTLNRDDNTRAVDSRLRLFTTAALNENVKAVFTVEVDYVWGDAGTGRVGADYATNNIEIANLYLDFNIPEANTNVKAGTHYYKLGGGLILGEHASGVSVRKAFTDNVNLGLYWVKMVEGLDENDDEDVDYYQAQLDMKAGGMTISPFVGYLDADDSGLDEEQYYYGLELSGKANALNYGMTAFYNDGRINGENNDAFAFLANADYTIGDTKLVFAAGRYGDSDTASGEMVAVRGYHNFSEILTGGYFDVRSAGAGTDQTVAGGADKINGYTGGNDSYYMNFQYAKVGVEQKLHEKGKMRVYYIYAEEAADNNTRLASALATRGGQKRITFGHEIDAYYDYTVVPGLVMTVGGGYLLADDDFGFGYDDTGKEIGGDDAWKAGLGLAYKF